MNKRIPAEEFAREEAADPLNYRREFLAEFLDDVDQFLPDSDITAAVQAGIREVAFSSALRGQYSAALDASGLTGADAFTLAIGHRVVRGSGRGTSLDAVRGWKRAPVARVCDEIATLLKTYELRSVVADQFGFTFLRELLSQRKIEVRQMPFTTRSKPEVMLELKTGLAQGRIALLDHPEALRELRMLESRRTSGGHYAIAAARGAHDDFATVIALLAFDSKSGNSSTGGFLAVGGKSGTRIIHANDNSDLPPEIEVERCWWRK